jgi:hypothetical protein
MADGESVCGSWNRRYVAATAILILSSCLAAAAFRGVWYDENWSLFLSSHDLPLSRVIVERWLVVVHPPLSDVLGWLIRPLAGDSLFVFRITNLVPAAFVLIALSQARAGTGAFGTLFAILLFSNPWSIRYFAEFRSYFAQICCAAVIIISADEIFTRPGDLRRTDCSLVVSLSVAIIWLLNLHYVAAALSSLVIGTLVVALVVAHKPRWAIATAAAGAFGLVLLALAYSAQRRTVSLTEASFWNTISPLAALELVLGMIALGAVANFTALVAAVIAVGARGNPLSGERQFLVWIAAALLAAALGALIFNAIRPVLVGRYVSILIPLAIAPVAALGAQVVSRRKSLQALLLLNAAVVALASSYKVGRLEDWDAGARFIADQKARCPGTVVHAVPHWQLEPPTHPVLDLNETLMNRRAYERLARRYHFRLEPEGSSRMSADCPTLVWAGHYYRDLPTPAFVAARSGLSPDPQSLAQGRALIIDDNVVMIYPRQQLSK